MKTPREKGSAAKAKKAVSRAKGKAGGSGRGGPSASGAAARARSGATDGWPGSLWASWRMEYIERADAIGCIFCEKPKRPDGAANLVLHRGETAFVILNAYPYNPGHLMVAPLRHAGEFSALTKPERAEIMDLIALSCDLLDLVMRPQGANVGVNLGRVAGAGIVGHIHFHVVPRWNGDTNFMPVVGHTKVLPEGLAATYAKLAGAFLAARTGK